MELQDLAVSGEIVQPIHVLRDQREARLPNLQLHKRAVRRIGRGLGDDLAAPVVPLPHQLRVARERLGRGEILRLVILPEAIGAAEGTGKSLGMTQTFIGIVFLAIVGGAAESGSAIAMGRKNKMDLSVGIALGSSIQIALFVAPVLVLLSYFIAPHPLELSFNRAETGSLFMGVLIGTLVCGDGQSNWYKGIQLVTVYTIIALMFYFIPGTAH